MYPLASFHSYSLIHTESYETVIVGYRFFVPALLLGRIRQYHKDEKEKQIKCLLTLPILMLASMSNKQSQRNNTTVVKLDAYI